MGEQFGRERVDRCYEKQALPIVPKGKASFGATPVIKKGVVLTINEYEIEVGFIWRIDVAG
jgi:hypothetical protein